MASNLSEEEIRKAEKRLQAKGCKRKIGDLWEVPISVLKIDQKFCFRKSRNSKVLKSMAQNIGEKGILNVPTAIYSLETDEIVLAAGFGRVACLKINNKEFVPCRIFINRKIVPQEIFTLILSDNFLREDIKPIELALLFRTWMKETGLRQKELAQKIHRSETYLSEILSPLKKLSEEEIDKILTSEFKRSQIVELAKIDDKDKRIELINGRASVREIRELTGKQKNKAKETDRRIFRISNKAARTSLGNAAFDLIIKFPNADWKNEEVVEILDEIIKKLKKSSEGDSHLVTESFNF